MFQTGYFCHKCFMFWAHKCAKAVAANYVTPPLWCLTNRQRPPRLKHSSRPDRGSGCFWITPVWYLKSLDLHLPAPATCATMFSVPGYDSSFWHFPNNEFWSFRVCRAAKMSAKFGAVSGTVNNLGKQPMWDYGDTDGVSCVRWRAERTEKRLKDLETCAGWSVYW